MASLAMASSVAVLVAAPAVAASQQASFSAVSSVRMAPVRFNRRMSVVAMASPAGTKKDNFGDKVTIGLTSFSNTFSQFCLFVSVGGA